MPSDPAAHVTQLIEALSRPEAYPHPVDAVEVIQTHISVVFLAGDYAYKVKKPVNLGFVDFTSLDKRKHDCDDEVRLNRRLAPHVYLGVVPITGSTINGQGDATEWAVQMKRLPADATLERRLMRGEVTEMQIRALAQRIAAFHRQAETSPHIGWFGRFSVVAKNARDNFTQSMVQLDATVHPIVFERVWGLTEMHLERLRERIDARAARGMPCDTHGDLHLDHIYLFPEEATPNDLVIIDCIEFAERFRYADPIADMAFLTMDLARHGRRDLARVFADAYFAASGDEEGRELLPFYAAYRAMVRAKVEGMKLGEREIDTNDKAKAMQRARAHWLVALGTLEQQSLRPLLLLVGGLPGSGKSTLARELAGPGNFEVLRSDVVRKEQATTAGDANIYTDAWTERTYCELLRRADSLLAQGRRVLVDANFRDDAWRRRFFDLAQQLAIPAYFIHCTTSPEIARQRLAARKHDASDADWSVYQALESSWQPLSDDIRRGSMMVDTSVPSATSDDLVRARLRAEELL